jgi:hypothetical protein
MVCMERISEVLITLLEWTGLLLRGLFRDQKSGIFPLEPTGLRYLVRIDRLLTVVATAALSSTLKGYAVSLAGERCRVDPHWKHCLSFSCIGRHWLQQSVITPAMPFWLGCQSNCRGCSPAFSADLSGDDRTSLGSRGLRWYR